MQIYIHIAHTITPYGQVNEAVVRTKERLRDWLTNYNERHEPECEWAGIFEESDDTQSILSLHVFDNTSRAMQFVMPENQPIICTGD